MNGIVLAKAGQFNDFQETIKSFRVWNLLALQDIRQRYRRSVIGPFWLTLSTFISILVLGLVYAKIFKISIEEYIPYLTVGFIFWSFIAGALVESCGVFIQAEGIIKQVNLPFGVHVMRMVWRNLIVLAHHSVVIGIVFIYFGTPIPLAAVYMLPIALIIIVTTAAFMGYLLGGLCARFRDVAQVISSLVQVVFYITPVIWKPVLLQGHEELLVYNPFFHYLQIMRLGLVGGDDLYNSWAITIVLTVFFGLVSLLFMRRYRRRISYWL